ncbi:factor of DNA methylation 1 isoform X1 [Triticum aestivum]|uniref:factor of DNA methylation 1 isoform X1 n=1 Tax=Triticum aestivum TaxID=4565 RepID=UPI001D02C371|nr:factor of DNA methylation 1-like isoform X1 [Triticum aestivum]XP_044387203.1 factor of DNA methylation 1-like isoform X1 [Triticum aestivum]
MAETGDASRLPTSLDVLASDVHSRLEFHRYAFMDCVGIKNALHCVIEERENLQQRQNAIDQLVAEKDSLTKKNEELAAELESLKEQLQARESSDQQQGSGFQQSHSGMAHPRLMLKRKRQSGDEDVDEHELMEDLSVIDNPDQGLNTELEATRKEISDIHSKLIEGFADLSTTGGRNIALKNIGQLDDRPFLAACRKKLPAEEAQEKAKEVHRVWQGHIQNPEWNPFKTVTVEGIPKEIIDVDDDKLQGLCAAWGEGVHKAVVSCLVEIQESGRLGDRNIVPEVWNYKCKRKATHSESIEYLFGQVKRLSDAKSRTRRRLQ